MSVSRADDLLAGTPALALEIIALVRDPFLILGPDLRVVAANDAFCLQFGVSEDAAVGYPIFSLSDGRWDTTELRGLLEGRARKSSIVDDYPLTLPGPSGALVVAACTVRPIRTGANEIERYLVSFRTAGVLSAASESDAMARIADEQVTDVVALYRRDGTCMHAGAACETVLGYGIQEWRSLRPCDIVHPRDQQALTEALGDEADEVGSSRVTLRVRRRSGEYLWMDVAIRGARDEALGQVVRVSARDVTQRKRAEDAVRWLSRHVKLILDSAAEGIFGVDTTGMITFINPAAAHALGYPVTSLTGQPYTMLLPADAGRGDDIGLTLKDGMARRATGAHFQRRDGRTVSVEYACSPARQHGEVVGGVVTFRDVSEKLRTDSALRRAEWLAGVGQTALALRHEINNPLTTLLAEASMLEIGGNSPEEEREMIGSIGYQARRIRDVVRRLTERQDNPPVRLDGAQAMIDLSEGDPPAR